MAERTAFPVGGYVLAGGRSARMGTDKALLELDGKPLIEHAVRKLRRICSDVHILSSNVELEWYAPLVPDLHPGCGPIGGIEAALLRSPFDWNVFLAVDMPFLPAGFMWGWMNEWMTRKDDGARLRMFTADGRLQPGFCLLHKDVTPFLFDAIRHEEFRLVQVFETAGEELARRRGLAPGAGLWSAPATASMTEPGGTKLAERCELSVAQLAAEHLWFANLNTPRDFAEAAENLEALDA
jgi:molybdopterin-guanine dinucleotide biosynthesis protein A